MKKTIIARTIFGLLSGGVLLSALPLSAALAAEPLLEAKIIEVETKVIEAGSTDLLSKDADLVSVSFGKWLPELVNKFNQLPEVQAQLVRQQQAELAIKAADRAVYNPELGLNYQNADTDTYSLGLSQTLDWGDKRGVATRRAQLEAQILFADIGLERGQMFAERLLALAEQAQASKALTFAAQQLRFTRAQLNIAEQRLAAGDLSDVELQLMQLELASNSADYALAEQAALVADGKVVELLGNDQFAFSEFIESIDGTFTQFSKASGTEPRLPALTIAYQQVLLARANAMQVKADTAADPTISIAAEKEGTDNKLGIGVSVPLQVRNNYSELQAIAEKDTAIAEQLFLARERVLTTKQKQIEHALPRLLARYQDWRELVQTSGAKAAKSLSQQWQAGDVSTSEYLQSRRQLAASYLVGLNLETAIYQTWLTWMGESGQLMPFIEQIISSPGMHKQDHSAPSITPNAAAGTANE
ncbi:TolC family protein [Shewanella sp. HN-41]|uniref:TolC family protein n=1 Tax=Shewanella sp. HN-41 TaxID=327275 RepID=UPI0002125F6A|nr:TolC family protein [Shewanella sp. HN-41]EGM68642.1 outer membrane protein, probably efflux family [Shewanella sp. HN-41]